MWHRGIAFRLIQAWLLSFGVSEFSSHASDVDTNLPSQLVTNVVGQRIVGDVIEISNRFAGFVPGSLANSVWTGFITNGRSTRIWEFWQLPPDWPKKPPV